jgi:fibronectin type 3 domain-containing protein
MPGKSPRRNIMKRWIGIATLVLNLLFWAAPWHALFAQGTHSITVSWTAPTVVGGSGTIAGYNVYRSTTSGGPYTKLTATVDAGLSYVDTTGAAGTTYFYVVTTVDSKGFESVDSGEASGTAVGNPNPPQAVKTAAN